MRFAPPPALFVVSCASPEPVDRLHAYPQLQGPLTGESASYSVRYRTDRGLAGTDLSFANGAISWCSYDGHTSLCGNSLDWWCWSKLLDVIDESGFWDDAADTIAPEWAEWLSVSTDDVIIGGQRGEERRLRRYRAEDTRRFEIVGEMIMAIDMRGAGPGRCAQPDAIGSP